MVKEFVVELYSPLRLVAIERGVHLKGDELAGFFETSVSSLEILQAAHEESGSEQQQEAEDDLSGDESLAQKERTTGACNGAHSVFQRCPQIGTAGSQGGSESENQAGQNGEPHGEGEDAQIGLWFD